MRKLYILTFFNLIILIANSNYIYPTKRNLDGDFSDLSIYLDLFNFNDTFPSDKFGNTKDIFINAMEEAKNILETIFLISPESNPDAGLEIDAAVYKEFMGISLWDDNIFIDEGTLSVAEYNIFIIFKFADLNNVDMFSKIAITYSNNMPIIGLVTINNNIAISKLNSGYLTTLFLQQFIKILWFQITFTPIGPSKFYGSIEVEIGEIVKKYDEVTGEELELGIEDLTVHKASIKKENVINYAKKYFACPSIEEIKLELDEYNNVYWPSRLFLGDIMTKFDNYEEKFISHFTLALLEDTGYLQVKKEFAYTGGLMRFGKHKGCEFLSGNCAPDDSHNSITFSNEFYLPSDTTKFPEPSCSSSRLGKTVYILHPVGENDIPGSGYEKNGYTGLAQTNYCPIAE